MNSENKPLTAGLDEIIRRFKCNPYLDQMKESYLLGCEDSAQQTAEKDARIKELEEQVEKYKRGDKIWSGMYDSILKELEAVKKERDMWKYKVEMGDISSEVAIDMLKKDRDALKDKLETAVSLLDKWAQKRIDHYGETKKFLTSLQTTGQNIQYISCPDCIEKGKDPGGMTIDGIYLECLMCDGKGQIVASPDETTAKEAADQ